MRLVAAVSLVLFSTSALAFSDPNHEEPGLDKAMRSHMFLPRGNTMREYESLNSQSREQRRSGARDLIKFRRALYIHGVMKFVNFVKICITACSARETKLAPIAGVRTALQYCRMLACSRFSVELFLSGWFFIGSPPCRREVSAADRSRPSPVADARTAPDPPLM